MKHRLKNLHYCSHCRATTRHSETEDTSTCLRCGIVKHVTRVVKASVARIAEE